MKNSNKIIKKVLFYLIIIKIFFSNIVNSEIIKKIEVSGNDRLAKETIIIFSELNVDDDISSKDLNDAFRKFILQTILKTSKLVLTKRIKNNSYETH